MEEMDDDFSLWQGYKNEVLILILILEDADKNEAMISREYILEKLHRILNEVPIGLHPLLWKKYKEERKKMEGD